MILKEYSNFVDNRTILEINSKNCYRKDVSENLNSSATGTTERIKNVQSRTQAFHFGSYYTNTEKPQPYCMLSTRFVNEKKYVKEFHFSGIYCLSRK